MTVLIVLFALLAPGVVKAFQPKIHAETLFQFDDHTFLENIAVRSNGHLLLSAVTGPFLYTFDPQATNSTPQVLHEFPNDNAITGIAEVAPDVFAVISGIFDPQTMQAESLCVSTVDLTGHELVSKEIVCIPETTMLNGMTALDHAPGVVLISDPYSGSVYRVNVATGDFDIVMQDPLLGPSTSFPFGINGLHARGNTLYFTNSGQGFFGLVPISFNGDQMGGFEKIAEISDPGPDHAFDDFSLDKEGNAWVMAMANTVNFITPDGQQSVVAGGGNSTQFAGPTSGAFGRGCIEEEATLYVTTSGRGVSGGQIVAVKIGV